MYFLVEPPALLRWTDLDAHLIEKAAAEHSVDLGRLPWQPTETFSFGRDVLRCALAHGIACSRGIAVSAHKVIPLGRPAELAELAAKVEVNRPKVHEMDVQAARTMEILNELETGQKIDASEWVVRGDQLSAEITEMAQQSIAEAEAEAQEILNAPARPELVEHWRSLGGAPLA